MIYFYEDNYLQNNKKNKSPIVLHIYLQILLMSDLMEDNWILIIASHSFWYKV